MRNLLLAVLLAALLPASVVAQAPAKTADCNQPLPDPVTNIALEGNPRFALSTSDGCWIFVTVQNPLGVVVLRRVGGAIEPVRFVPVQDRPWGMALTQDQKVLIASGNRQTAFLDVEQLVSDKADVVPRYITDPRFGDGGVGIAVTADDKYLFVPQRTSNWLSIINLEKARSLGYNAAAVEAGIPIGPGGMAILSSDERHVYIMNTSAPQEYAWPAICADIQTSEPSTEGVLQVIDVERAKSSAKSAVIASVSLGCNTSRIVLSTDGETLYAGGGQMTLSAFDMRPLAAGSAPKLIGSVSAGERVPARATSIAILDGGRKAAITGNVGGKPAIAVIDTAKIAAGQEAILGIIPAGDDPRNLSITSDGRTLLLTNSMSKTLHVFDLGRLPLILKPAPNSGSIPAVSQEPASPAR